MGQETWRLIQDPILYDIEKSSRCLVMLYDAVIFTSIAVFDLLQLHSLKVPVAWVGTSYSGQLHSSEDSDLMARNNIDFIPLMR